MCVSARLYHCARCHCQVTICRYCDRGNIYCGGDCAKEARKDSLHRSSVSYQSSRRGQAANARRQKDFRQRQREKVTHQGSTPDTPGDLLHLSNELAYFFINRRSARELVTTFPGPVVLKTFAVPAHNRIGVQRVQHCPPSVDIFGKQNPKQAVGGRYLRALHRRFEHSELLAERQILQRQLTV